jgi:hypothetical protein
MVLGDMILGKDGGGREVSDLANASPTRGYPKRGDGGGYPVAIQQRVAARHAAIYYYVYIYLIKEEYG